MRPIWAADQVNTQQLCRMCHVLVDESDDHLHQPKYKTQPQISRLVKSADRRA